MTLTDKAQKIFDLVKELTAVELAALVTALEEEFGVTAAAMVVAGGAAAGGEEGGAAKDTVNVELTDAGQQKIAVIKVVREITGLALGDAKAAVDGAPKVIKEGVAKADAEEMKKKLEEAGAKVTLK